MSRLNELSGKIKKKKMTLDQYTPSNTDEAQASKPQDVYTSSHQDVNESTERLKVNEDYEDNMKKEKKPQLKTTVYFREKTKRQLDEIYAKRILNSRETDKTDLISEAIELLYQNEQALHV